MKKILSFVAFLAISIISVQAQDSRGRTPQTVVQDALAQMPVEYKADFDREFKYLADSAPETVTILASMLKDAKKGENALVEYALNGLCNYASDPANKDCLNNVKEGFENAAKACKDKNNKQFLESQLRLLSSEDNPLEEFKDYEYTATAKEALKALKSSDRKKRVTTLEAVNPDESFLTKLSKKFNSLSGDAKVDVLNWAGTTKQSSLLSLIQTTATKSGGEVGEAAAVALSKIGGNDAAATLISLIGNSSISQDVVLESLSSVKADNLSELVIDAMNNAKGDNLCTLMSFASSKHITEASDCIFANLDASGAKVKATAVEALKGVVTVDDADKVASLLDNSKNKNTLPYTEALAASLSTLSGDEIYTKVYSLMESASNSEKFYPVLASSGTADAAKTLAEKAENGSKDALKALCSVDNAQAIKPLLSLAGKDDSVLSSAANLMVKYISDKDDLSSSLCDVLDKASSSQLKADILSKLSVYAPTMESFIASSKLLNDKDLKIASAEATKVIASKCTDDIDYDVYVKALKKAQANYEERGLADDGYAIKEITKMISEAQPAEKVTMTDEEKAEGFEVLFDGTDMKKWEGNLEGYTKVNGTINVSAQFGNDMNLYTKKEYQDFVLRFEFCFTRPGVNNGIGVRTPEGVDAAYYGMCEVQVLDHDDPIYADLRPYQVHGSVYGVIPAKRIVHKPLGEWSTEEIRVEGDHITVTVNGEVIVDGDVREACEGHNVVEGQDFNNPYTVDHRNHPGLFNEKGHISFCGHGVGMKYRNVRVLDLTAKNASAKKSSRKSK